MPAITTMILAAIGGVMFSKMMDRFDHVIDIIRSPVLKPVNRTVLQNYTTSYTNSVTEKYIKKTVSDIYENALTSAALRREGYQHPFSPLLPIHVYPQHTYVPKIVKRLEKLFPECSVTMDDRLGMYVIQWF